MRTTTTAVGLPLCRGIRAAFRESTLACTDMWMCAWAGMDVHAGADMSGSRNLLAIILWVILQLRKQVRLTKRNSGTWHNRRRISWDMLQTWQRSAATLQHLSAEPALTVLLRASAEQPGTITRWTLQQWLLPGRLHWHRLTQDHTVPSYRRVAPKPHHRQRLPAQ